MLAYFQMPLPASHERQTRSTQIRHGDALADLIETAAEALCLDKSTFLRAAVEQAAHDVIERQRRHKLTEADTAAFMAAMDYPAMPTGRAVRSARLYRTRVVHAD